MSDRWPLHGRIRSTFYRRLLAVARPLALEIPNPPREFFEVRLLAAGDLSNYLDLRGTRDPALFQTRLPLDISVSVCFQRTRWAHRVGRNGRVLIDYSKLSSIFCPATSTFSIHTLITHFRRRRCTAARALVVRAHFLARGLPDPSAQSHVKITAPVGHLRPRGTKSSGNIASAGSGISAMPG